MALALFKPQRGPKFCGGEEKILSQVEFNIHKLNCRIKPKQRERIKIIGCFSEFGCETLGAMYCVPRILRRFPGQYIIAMGWYGREYLYRHLVDEFWEVKEEYMWLRDYARAFHHVSRNLARLEKSAAKFGEVIPSAMLGKYAVANFCRTCGKFWQEWRKRTLDCPQCQSTVLVRSIFTDIEATKPTAVPIPKPRQEFVDWAEQLVPKNAVGIFARNRKTYGRNLSADFYIQLIQLLQSKGYSIVWLGEKQSTLPCPVEGVLDFSSMSESRDLERTLAVISRLQFTIQFWTASTRLAGMMEVPYLLFESPEQIYASYSGIMSAQEGKRLELATFGKKKIVISHYHSIVENQDEGLALVSRAIKEMSEDNYEDILGLVENMEFTETLRQEHYEMLT